jgi:D-threo-aldose 1-dehydrogenase
MKFSENNLMNARQSGELPPPKLTLPRVVFGATNLGNLFQQPTDFEKHEIVKQWMASGLEPTLIDSAGKYGAGLSLEVIGRELAALGVPQDKVLISNKLGWRRVPLTAAEPTFEPGVWINIQHDAVQDISRDGILRCWKEGNELLGEYKAGLLSVHDPDEYLAAAHDAADRQRRLEDILEAYETLSDLKRQGETLGVGVGAKDWRAIQELDRLCQLDWVMIANSFTILEHPPELVDFISSLGERGIAVINSALFHGGFLFGNNYFNYRPIDPSQPEDIVRIERRQKLMDVCRAEGVDVFDVGVAFGKSHPAVTSIALSSSRAERIPSHVAAVERVIPERVWQRLREEGVIAPHYTLV